MEFDRCKEKRPFRQALEEEELGCQSRIFSYMSRGLYAAQIEALKEYFSMEQMLFIKYERFLEDEERELKRVFDFLNVAKNYEFDHTYVASKGNHSTRDETITPADRAFVIKNLENDIKELEFLLGWDCCDWLRL